MLARAVFWLLFSGLYYPAYADSFAFIYIEPGEGDSSGGHAAVQFGDKVYHFQHDSTGLIRLKRQNATEFQFGYQYLQNRPLHVSHIALRSETYIRLIEQFKTTFWAQQRQFEQLDQLSNDRWLLQYLLRIKRHQVQTDPQTDDAMRLKGVGLFFNINDIPPSDAPYPPAKPSPSLTQLRKDIGQHYGEQYLQQRLADMNTAIHRLTADNWQTTHVPLLSTDKFPQVRYAFNEAYRNLVTDALAIYVLQQARPLRSDAWVTIPLAESRLNAKETALLDSMRQHLHRSVLALLHSDRPDWGYALLVNLARLAAVERTLETRHWVFVDDFSDQGETIDAPHTAHQLSQIKALTIDAQHNLLLARRQFSADQHYAESRYSSFEMAANRYIELSQGQRPIRLNAEAPLPSKSIELPLWLIPELSERQISAALLQLDHYHQQLLAELQPPYAYNLVSKNCVTELFRTIHQALALPLEPDSQGLPVNPANIIKQLGGYVDENTYFIPVLAYHAVNDSYRVTGKQTLLSFRQQRLLQQDHEENPLLASLRETNTLSSTLYGYNPKDAFFIFFTDNYWLLRPLFGAINASAGAGQTLSGLATLPFDGGKSLASGISGMLMSLPELVFVNIRKGSYPYLSYRQFFNENGINDLK